MEDLYLLTKTERAEMEGPLSIELKQKEIKWKKLLSGEMKL